MNRKLPAVLAIALSGCAVAAGQTITDPAHIEIYVTPYYNSKGPTIEVGPFSSGLAAKNESEFVATIAKMKKSWDTLNFPETYVAAIRLYDLGYRKDCRRSSAKLLTKDEARRNSWEQRLYGWAGAR